MKLLCTHSYYARHHKELAEFVKNPERDIVLISDTAVSKPPSFDYFVIDSDTGNQIGNFHANLNTYFIENNHQLATEIFCRATDGSYKDFNQYAAEFCAFTPKESLNLPYVVDESIRKVSRILELAEIEINTPLLVYSVYKSRYEPTKYPYGATDVIFDIVDSMLELKKEGMIQ